jgi:hypothetical protein
LFADHDKAFKHLLILDSLRGIDSTGAAFIDMAENVEIVKAVGNPYELMDLKVFDKKCNRANKVALGHNRFATQGLVTRRNAHPFEFEHVVGAHNGTITNKYKMLDQQYFTVDSENLFHMINETTIDETLPQLEGAWSLVYWDKRENHLHFIRNKERPMWIATSEDDKSIMWASEDWMIHIAAGRNNLKMRPPTQTKIDRLYTFFIGADGSIEEKEGREIKGKEPFVYQQAPFRQQTPWPNIPSTATPAHQAANTSVTPTGKVVVFPSKEEPNDPKAQSSKYGDSYLPNYSASKDVELYVGAECRDHNGSFYLDLTDIDNPMLDIRLYLNQKDKPEMYKGRIVIGDIEKFWWNEKLKHGFYKVSYSKHKLKKKEELFPNAKGDLVSQSEWINQHGTCVWCQGAVFPDEKHEFVDCGSGTFEAICKHCVNDPEVRQYI